MVFSLTLLLVGSVRIDITGSTSAATKPPIYFHSLYLCLRTVPRNLSYYLIIHQFVESVMKILTVDHGLLSEFRGQ